MIDYIMSDVANSGVYNKDDKCGRAVTAAYNNVSCVDV